MKAINGSGIYTIGSSNGTSKTDVAGLEYRLPVLLLVTDTTYSLMYIETRNCLLYGRLHMPSMFNRLTVIDLNLSTGGDALKLGEGYRDPVNRIALSINSCDPVTQMMNLNVTTW